MVFLIPYRNKPHRVAWWINLSGCCKICINENSGDVERGAGEDPRYFHYVLVLNVVHAGKLGNHILKCNKKTTIPLPTYPI